MKLETGTPSLKGRYVAYVQCESVQIRGWCEAKLAIWLGDRWDIGVPVFYFAGPLRNRNMTYENRTLWISPMALAHVSFRPRLL